MITGLSQRPARWLLLPGAVPTGTGGVLMSPADRGVHIHLPRNQTGRIGPGLERGQYPGPYTLALPAPEQPVHGLPVPVLGRQIPPRDTGPHPPPHPVDQPPLVTRRTTHPRCR